MAATGLLGINPYQQGVNIDISSKPVALVFQLEQKEAAKREALQKYLMDYEKSLNPAGMRAVDQDAFLKKLNQAKEYNLKNTREILNPAKYGSEAQSTYTGLLKEAQNLIEQSKAQAAEDKVVNEHIYQATQQGKTIHDGLLPSIEASRRSIIDPMFKKVNPWELRFDDKYDDNDFTKNVWSGITLPTKEVVKETLPTGEKIYEKQPYLTPGIRSTVITNALSDYTSKPNAARYLNDLMKNPQIYEAVNANFGEAFKYFDPLQQKEIKPNIGDKTPGINLDPTQQFVVGYALTKKPTGEGSIGKPEMPWLEQFKMRETAAERRHRESMANARSVAAQNVPSEMGNELDNIEDIAFKSGGGLKNGVAVDASGNPWSGEAEIPAKNVSGLLFDIIGADPKNIVVTYKNGVPVKLNHPQVGTLTRQNIENYQMKFNTEPAKGKQLKFGREGGSKFKGVPTGGF